MNDYTPSKYENSSKINPSSSVGLASMQKQKIIMIGASVLILSILMFFAWALIHTINHPNSGNDYGRASDVAIWLDDVINNIETGDKNSASYAFIENTRSFSADGFIDRTEYQTLLKSYSAIKEEEGMTDIQDSLTKIDARNQ